MPPSAGGVVRPLAGELRYHTPHGQKKQTIKQKQYCSNFNIKTSKMLFDFFFLKITQLCLTLCDPIGYTVRGILQARILEGVAFPSSRGPSPPRDRTQAPCIAGGFFTTEPPGKPTNAGVGSQPVLQQIFPTQESNQALLCCCCSIAKLCLTL